MWQYGRTAITGAEQVDVEQAHLGRGLREDVRDLRDGRLEARDRVVVIHATGQLCRALDATMRQRREVLDRVAEDLAVADQREDVVRA